MNPVKFLFLTAISFILFTSLSAQTFNYDSQWKKVDQLAVKKNLPASALAEVKKIYSQAKKDRQDAQVIKALVYMVNLQSQTRENNQTIAIAEIEKEIGSASGASLSILKSYLATLYWSYYQEVQWQLYNRTTTEKFVKTDIATWSADDFHKTISRLFLESIDQDRMLKSTRLEPWDAIITKGNTRKLRPTLYDLLAQRALEYFKNDERYIRKPSYAFEISQVEAFATAEQFIATHFTTKDSSSLQYKALLVYQELLRFHINDKDPDALLDADIDRIAFVYAKSVLTEKDSLYVNALVYILKRFPENKESKEAAYLLASYYFNLAQDGLETPDTTHKEELLKAKTILEKIVADSSSKTETWANSYDLLRQITEKTFSFQLEKVNLPEQPFRCLVNYKNIGVLHFRMLKATEELKKIFRDGLYEENSWDQLIVATPIKSWKQELPVAADYSGHSVEVKIDALPVGEYFLFASVDQQFAKKGNPLSVQLFYVSNISFINQKLDFFVLNRETGLPLSQAKVQLWQRRYDRNTSAYIKEKSGSYLTDAQGYFRLVSKKSTPESYNYQLEITYNKDRLFLDNEIQDYFSGVYKNATDTMSAEQFENETAYTYLFTDRSIYRPGQMLYFKGITIATTREGNKKSLTGFRSTIYLRNANFKVVDSIDVSTNEYGSFSGKFNLPMNTLNGNFTLEMKRNRGSVGISVEEYKRPKFSVEFEKIHETYKVNDSITVIGNAKAYAGNLIDGAKVVYRVVRQPRMLYDWLWKIWPPRGNQTEIAHGETVTDVNGKFKVRFMALPDKTIKPEFQPVFDYTVYADVTDINGETRSQQFHLSAGYVSVVIKSEIPKRIPVDSLKEISIRTENMNGEFQPSLVTVTMYQLVPEQRLVRSRLWQNPDRYIMTKQEFLSFFPNDEYKTETDFTTWERGEIVYRKSDSTRVNGEWSMVNAKIPKGYYVFELTTKDKDGKEVKDIKYVELFDQRSKELTHPEYMWTYQPEKTYEPGETATIQLASSSKNVFLIQKTKNAKESSSAFNFQKIDGNKTSFSFPVREEDRGNIIVNYLFVKNNRFYQYNTIIIVPWSNKELSVEYVTFRDKTLPGSEEKWKVKIRGNKNEKVAAEMLAGMYDASLDQFKPHNWTKPNIWIENNYTEYWNSQGNFEVVNSHTKWINPMYPLIFSQKIYDELIFNLYGMPNNWQYSGKMVNQSSLGNISIRGVSGAPPAVRRESRGEEVAQAATMQHDMNPDIRYKSIDISADGRTEAFDSNTINNNIPKTDPSIQPRKNFNETSFFFPDLRTDSSGMIEFSFTVPEALTRWKLQTLAHTKDLAFGVSQKDMVTQKELMVQPNMPRFLRQGDRIELVTKIVNNSDSEMTGQVQLQLFDAATNQSVDGWFVNSFPNQYFTIAAKQSSLVKFPVQVPFQFNSALTWRITASTASPTSKAVAFSDGEEDNVAVLSNKVLVTETMPLPMKGSGTKNFVFTKLANTNSETLQHHSLTVEYTANPAWYAVQALPYLMEFPYECAEQTWNRFYANALASDIVNKAPRIRQMFNEWKNLDTSALLSNLEKNQEFKSALLEETPWVLDAKNESQQKKNIALLFDLVRMQNELNANLEKLSSMLGNEGSFPWFRGGQSDRYITQYIATGIGHLLKLKSISAGQMKEIMVIVKTIIPYLDRKVYEDYQRLLKSKADISKQQTSPLLVHYLYMRSFFKDQPVPVKNQTALAYYQQQSKKFWMKYPVYEQGMIAMVLNRNGDGITATAILKSLKETSILNEELGRYWKYNSFGRSWTWNTAPIETQSLMVEVFTEIGKDPVIADELRTWLIRNKQTNNWNTTKATADACYAMLLRGTDWLANTPDVSIQIGNKNIHPDKTEAGTGYFKQTIDVAEITPSMGNIRIEVKPATSNQKPVTSNQQPASSWGAVYWQYFEDMDKVTGANTPLSISKKLFIEKNTDKGPVLTPVEEGSSLHVGDKIKVRIELRSDRDMEYIHMKDMRASGLEPVNVLSGYKWQGGLGYYESTRDAATHFFFDVLRKGTYVFEYPLFVSHNGTFSNGITTIQCMYAPEFSAHSEGVSVRVEE